MRNLVGGLLSLLLCCGKSISQHQYNEHCVYRVESQIYHHGVYDLNPLADSTKALTYDNSVDGSVYEATFCDSFRLMRPHCPVADAVAAKTGHCEYFGRSSSLESVSYMNDTDPRHGVVITYGNGGSCPGHADLSNRVTFVVACDRYESAPVVFTNVHFRSSSCEYVYYFRSRHGCPHLESIMAEDGPMHIFFILLLCIVTYCLVGYFYNVNYKGATGVEALPHINFIRKSYKSISTKCSGCCSGDASTERRGGPLSDVATGMYIAAAVMFEDAYALVKTTLFPGPGGSFSSSSSSFRSSTAATSGVSSGDRYASLLGNMSEHGMSDVSSGKGPIDANDDNEEISINFHNL